MPRVSKNAKFSEEGIKNALLETRGISMYSLKYLKCLDIVPDFFLKKTHIKNVPHVVPDHWVVEYNRVGDPNPLLEGGPDRVDVREGGGGVVNVDHKTIEKYWIF